MTGLRMLPWTILLVLQAIDLPVEESQVPAGKIVQRSYDFREADKKMRYSL